MNKYLLFVAILVTATGCVAQPTKVDKIVYQPAVEESRRPISDAGLTTKVKSAFMAEKLFGSASIPIMSIKVDTINRVVYLSGTAGSQQQARDAVAIARSVEGVSRVESRIIVIRKH